MTDGHTDDIKALYRRAFREFGSITLGNMRPKKDPTPADAPAITTALRTHGAWMGGGSRQRVSQDSRGTQFPAQPRQR